MKKKCFKLIVIWCMVMLIIACGNDNSKVNQVIQNQIQAETNKPDRNEDNNKKDEPNTEEVQDNASASDEIDNPDDNQDDYEDDNQDDNVKEPATSISEQQDAQIDVDLTELSNTMVYSEVYNMVYEPEKYIGKLVKMKGGFNLFQNSETGQLYFACIISDATACCAQGIEFELEGEHVYPDDYPEVGTEIIVTGIFETYEEDGYMYCRLQNANMQ